MKNKENFEKVLEELGMYLVAPNLYCEGEDIAFNIKTKELFYHNCVDGSLELCCKIEDEEHLKEMLWLCFKHE